VGVPPFFSRAELRLVRAPRPTTARCGHCGLKDNCQTPKMRPDGRGRRRVLMVSEFPGATEDAAGKPLVGRAGQKLESVVGGLGFDLRRDCWLHNAVICHPTGQKRPPESAVDDCRPNLLNTINELDPDVIVLLGGDAIRGLLEDLWRGNLGGAGRWTGWTIPCQQTNRWICPTHSPAYLLHEDHPVLERHFRDHLAAAFALDGRPWPDGPPDYPAAVEPILDADVAARRLGRYKRGVVAFDFENNPLKPDHERAEIVSCAVCWNNRETIAFPWHGAVKDAMRDLLTNPDVGKIASNLKHEQRWCLRKLGFRVRNWVFDTMLAAHALDPRGGISALKFQAFVRFGVPDWSHHISPFLDAGRGRGGNAPNRIKEIGLPLTLRYNGLDALHEFAVAEVQAAELGIPLTAGGGP
jgi:uracil-DNA glycosylase family 4